MLKRIYTTHLFVWLLWLLFFGDSYAQKASAPFEAIQTGNDYDITIVHDIIQDKEGFIWLGTVDGLYQYNGYDFTIYKQNTSPGHSISGNTIRALCEDNSGYIWVGTQEGGLNRFDKINKKFINFCNQKDSANHFDSDNAWKIVQDSKGRLWVGTWGFGLYLVPNPLESKEEIRFINFKNRANDSSTISHNVIRSIYEDRRGNIWIGTQGGGLNCYVEKDSSFVRYSYPKANAKGLNHNGINDIVEGYPGGLWLGTNGGGLDFLNTVTGKYTSYYNEGCDYINAIQMLDNNLLIGTEAGTRLFNLSSKRFTWNKNLNLRGSALEDKLVRCIYKDHQGLIWMGTDGGAYKLKVRKAFYHYYNMHDEEGNIVFNTVRTICETSDSALWVGTLGKGLNRLNQKSGDWTHFLEDPANPNAISDNQVLSLYEDQEGTLWVGTIDGFLHKYISQSQGFEKWLLDDNPQNTPNMIQSIIGDENDILWIGTENGLVRFNKKDLSWTTFKNDPNNPNSLSGNNIQSKGLMLDKEGNLWIGTWNNGLNMLVKDQMNAKSPVFKHWKHKKHDSTSLGNNNVLSLYEDQKGTLWIGTYGGGLDKLNRKTGVFSHFTEEEGLSNNVIFSILEDDEGYLWLSSNNGLCKIKPETLEVSNYDKRDGLQGNTYFWGAAFKNKYGYLYFGGVNGIDKFNPLEIVQNRKPPEVVITDLKVYNQSKSFDKYIAYTDMVELSYADTYITLEFAALDFSDSRNNQYMYKLEGFDESWIYNGYNRSVSYNNLPGGVYTFKVKGTNNDGVWSKSAAELTIVISPPWYETMIFKVIIGAFLILVILVFIRLREGIWKMQNSVLEEKVSQRTREIAIKNQEIQDQSEKLLEANQKIKGINENLERIIEQRSARLKAINDDLVSINEELDMFLYKTSHDFRSPIRTLLGLSAIANFELKSAHNERAIVLFNRVKETALSMDKMLAKLNKTHLILSSAMQQESVDMQGLIEELQEKYSLINPDIQWQIHINLPDNPVWINCMEALYTCIDYIIENANDFAPHPSLLIIKILVYKVDDEQMQICITDNGSGMKHEILPRVFDMYYRGSTFSKGNGLGLYVVKKAVEKMKGEITIDSYPGRGTTIIMNIPYFLVGKIHESSEIKI